MKKLGMILISLFMFTQNLLADEQEILKKHFLSKIDTVISIVENKNIDKVTRNSNIVHTLTPMFDFELMAKLSLGKIWKTLNPTEQKDFVNLYVERMKQSYSSKIDAYSDEKVEVTHIHKPKSNRIEIITNLISKTDTLEIAYKFYKPKRIKENKNNWLIYDVVILGVSILKTDKAQFKEFLQTKNIQQLMAQLVLK